MTGFILYYCLIYSVLVGIGLQYIAIQKKKVNRQTSKPYNLNELTVVIPFRDEEQRIAPLIQSINQAAVQPAQYIFVDDHSTDNTQSIIRNSIRNDIPYLVLDSKQEGKKNAVLKGVEQAQTKFILTLDADVSFESNYFKQINKIAVADMTILPVKMNSVSWKNLFEMDIYLVGSLNQITTGIKRPIVASGANLIFSKTQFLNYNSIEKHKNLASGDDQFLLADFNQNKLSVELIIANELAVTTAAPSNLLEFFNQRIRWFSKTSKVGDSFANLIGFVQLILTGGFATGLILCLFNEAYLTSILLLAIKSSLDGILVWNYLYNINRTAILKWIPVYELLYPLYSILILIFSIFFTPNWKGRTIKKPSLKL
ncbi:MAG TPA: glycosyltransferase [Taishania sp.]|nr:glycosyltransferase [Taishania sp.]